MTAQWANPTYADISDNPSFNFDDLGSAYLTVVEVIGLEGFVEVMGAAMDTTALDSQPKFGDSPLHSLYFVAVITIGTFFITELYAGVIIQSYTKADGSAFLTDEQRLWAEEKSRLRAMKLRRPLVQDGLPWWRKLAQDVAVPCDDGSSTDTGGGGNGVAPGNDGATGKAGPESPVREGGDACCNRSFHALHSRFDTIVAVLVLLNVLVLACRFVGMPDTLTQVLDVVDHTLLALFTVEMVVTMAAVTPRVYWRTVGYAFDGGIVVGSLLLLLLSAANIRAAGVSQTARLFRIGRLLRLVKRFPQLNQLMETLIRALPSMGNITALLVLVLFIGSIVGMELFGDVPYREEGPGLTRLANFQSFPSALLLLFRALTGENIQVVVRDCQRVHAYAPVVRGGRGCTVFFRCVLFHHGGRGAVAVVPHPACCSPPVFSSSSSLTTLASSCS